MQSQPASEIWLLKGKPSGSFSRRHSHAALSFPSWPLLSSPSAGEREKLRISWKEKPRRQTNGLLRSGAAAMAQPSALAVELEQDERKEGVDFGRTARQRGYSFFFFNLWSADPKEKSPIFFL